MLRPLTVNHVVAAEQLARGGAGAHRALGEGHFAVDHCVADALGLLDDAALSTGEVVVVDRTVILQAQLVQVVYDDVGPQVPLLGYPGR